VNILVGSFVGVVNVDDTAGLVGVGIADSLALGFEVGWWTGEV